MAPHRGKVVTGHTAFLQHSLPSPSLAPLKLHTEALRPVLPSQPPPVGPAWQFSLLSVPAVASGQLRKVVGGVSAQLQADAPTFLHDPVLALLGMEQAGASGSLADPSAPPGGGWASTMVYWLREWTHWKCREDVPEPSPVLLPLELVHGALLLFSPLCLNSGLS